MKELLLGGSRAEIRRSEEGEIAGLEVRFASLDHLIAMKRAPNRPKDKLRLEEYIVIADERRAAAQRVEGSVVFP